MKRVATWLLYIVGAVAIAYLALYAYVMLTGSSIVPGKPIPIFRKEGAPSYSARPPVRGQALAAIRA